MASLKSKVIAITGGASGIGLATAKIVASRGANVSIADVQDNQFDAAKKAIKDAAPDSGDVLTVKCDVRKLSDVQDWLQQTIDKFGRLDGAANLAGTIGKDFGTFTVEDEDEENWDFIIGVNLTGVMHCVKAELKHLQDGGSIVNASSVAGLRGFNRSTAYVASKHGVIGITRTAAKDFGHRNIRVNAIAPGVIDTPMVHKAAEVVGTERFDRGTNSTALARRAQPEEVGRLIAFLLSDEASFITGAIYPVDAGMSA